MMLELLLVLIPLIALVTGAAVLDRKRRRRDGHTSHDISSTVGQVRADVDSHGYGDLWE
jgi:hypothetical protein